MASDGPPPEDFDYGEKREDGQYERHPTTDEGEIERSGEEIDRKLTELRETPSPLDDGPGGRDEAYRMDGKMRALGWVLGVYDDL